jgi:hypothetical protein
MVLVAVLAATTHAQVTDFRLEQIDNSNGGPALDGFVTNNLVIDFNGTYTGSQILLELERGSIYQDPLGSNNPPSSMAVSTVPSLAFDTYLALGSAISEGSFGPANLVGGAVDLGGEPSSRLETSRLNAAWGPQPGANIQNQSDFLTARITLSENAHGSWRLLGSANGVISIVGPPNLVDRHTAAIHFAESGVVRSGVFLFAVPEPSTLALALLLLLVLAGARLRWKGRGAASV